MKLKIILNLFFATFLFFSSFNLVFATNFSEKKYTAEVYEIASDKITVKVLEGSFKNSYLEVIEYDKSLRSTLNLKLQEKVIINIDSEGQKALIVDKYRINTIIILFTLFLLTVLVIGRGKGILSLVALFFSFLVIINGIIPQILLGNNPIVISLLAGLFIIPFNFYLSHGVSKKTTVAVIATFLTLVVTGVLAVLFSNLANLTGYSSEEASFLNLLTGRNIDIKALLLAGILIGAMGVLDDITISQASIVFKLKKNNPKITSTDLFNDAMDIGRDHIASLVNTLVLVYAGASLPLFVLFATSNIGPFNQVANMEAIATEIVRTLVSSIGIILAVPITTLLSVVSIKRSV